MRIAIVLARGLLRWWTKRLLSIATVACAVSFLASAAVGQTPPALWQTYMRTAISAFLAERYSEAEVLLQSALMEADKPRAAKPFRLLAECVLRDVRAEATKQIIEAGPCTSKVDIVKTTGPELLEIAGSLQNLASHLNDKMNEKLEAKKDDPEFKKRIAEAVILAQEAQVYSVVAVLARMRGSSDSEVALSAAEAAFYSAKDYDYEMAVRLYQKSTELLDRPTRHESTDSHEIVKPVVITAPAILGNKLDLTILLILSAKAQEARGMNRATQSTPDYKGAEQDFYEAEASVAKALRIWIQTWPDHPNTYTSLRYVSYVFTNRAEFYDAQGKKQDAAKLRAAVARLDATIEKEKDFNLNQALTETANLLRMTGHAEDAEQVNPMAKDSKHAGVATVKPPAVQVPDR